MFSLILNQRDPFMMNFYPILLRIIGIGLTDKYAKKYLENESYYPEGGIYKSLSKFTFLDPHGVLLGYDVLGNDYGAIHSYLCVMMESRLNDIGVKWNEYGFISSFEDACKAAEYLSSEGDMETDDYYPWIVLEYEKN